MYGTNVTRPQSRLVKGACIRDEEEEALNLAEE